VQVALRALRREQREDTVVDLGFKRLLSSEWYRLAPRGGRLHLPRGNFIRGIRADVKTLVHTSRQLAGDTPLRLVAFLKNFQTACDGSGLNEGTAVTLLQYFVTSEVLGKLQLAKDVLAPRVLTDKRAVRALLNEYLDGDDLVDHLQSLMQASQEKWRDEHDFSNRILDANHALSSVLQQSELKNNLLKGVGREIRALGRNFNTQGRTFPKLRKFLAKTVAANRQAWELQVKPRGGTPRSAGGEEQESRRTRSAASVALPVGAASAAAALAVPDDGSEAERAEWAAVLTRWQRPLDTAPKTKSRLYRWKVCPKRRAGNSSPRGAGARSCTPSERGWDAGAAPWRLVPLCPRVRGPFFRTRAALRGSPVAGPRLHAVGHRAARPKRAPRPGCGKSARSVAI